MTNLEELQRQNEALRERLSRLSQASLLITEDLELEAVLQGVADGARSLTGAASPSWTTRADSSTSSLRACLRRNGACCRICLAGRRSSTT